jgi:hypothetical protein
MSATLQDSATSLPADPANLQAMSAALRARLAKRAASAPKQELDQILNLIGALDSARTTRPGPLSAAPSGGTIRARHVRPEQHSNLRHYIYKKAAYAPAPVFHSARALGHALRFFGI